VRGARLGDLAGRAAGQLGRLAPQPLVRVGRGRLARGQRGLHARERGPRGLRRRRRLAQPSRCLSGVCSSPAVLGVRRWEALIATTSGVRCEPRSASLGRGRPARCHRGAQAHVRVCAGGDPHRPAEHAAQPAHRQQRAAPPARGRVPVATALTLTAPRRAPAQPPAARAARRPAPARPPRLPRARQPPPLPPRRAGRRRRPRSRRRTRRRRAPRRAPPPPRWRACARRQIVGRLGRVRARA